MSSQTWVTEAAGPGLHFRLQCNHLGIRLETRLKILQLLALLLLDLQGNLADPVQEEGNLLELIRVAPSRRHGWGANAHTTGRESGGITVHGIAVRGDGAHFADLLHLRAREPMRTQVPKHKVIVGTVAGQLVALLLQHVGNSTSVDHHLLRVLLEGWGRNLEQLNCQTTDLVVVGAALQAWEDGHVDALLNVGHNDVLEKDYARTGTSQGLVRSGGDHIAMLEGPGMLARSDQARDMRNVSHEQRAALVGNLPELREVNHAGVGR